MVALGTRGLVILEYAAVLDRPVGRLSERDLRGFPHCRPGGFGKCKIFAHSSKFSQFLFFNLAVILFKGFSGALGTCFGEGGRPAHVSGYPQQSLERGGLQESHNSLQSVLSFACCKPPSRNRFIPLKGRLDTRRRQQHSGGVFAAALETFRKRKCV